MEITNFEEDKKKSVAPDIRRRNYSIILEHFPIKKFDAIELDPGIDKFDYVGVLDNGKSIKIEFKNYGGGNTNFNYVCLEQINYGDKLGWTFNIEADYILFTWHGKKKKCYLIVEGKPLENWWKEHSKDYEIKLNKISKSGEESWQSSYSKVPIEDLPKELIYIHKKFSDLNDFW